MRLNIEINTTEVSQLSVSFSPKPYKICNVPYVNLNVTRTWVQRLSERLSKQNVLIHPVMEISAREIQNCTDVRLILTNADFQLLSLKRQTLC